MTAPELLSELSPALASDLASELASLANSQSHLVKTLKHLEQIKRGHFTPIFVTGTNTDVGKTYVTALLCRELKQALHEHQECHALPECSEHHALSTSHERQVLPESSEHQVLPESSERQVLLKSSELHALPKHQQQAQLLRRVSYYKAAISGADSIAASDAGYVNTQAGLEQDLSSLTSYLYAEAVSPHLAQLHQGSAPITLNSIMRDFSAVFSVSALTVLEGSGGIYCPLCWPLNLPYSSTIFSTKPHSDSSSNSSPATTEARQVKLTNTADAVSSANATSAAKATSAAATTVANETSAAIVAIPGKQASAALNSPAALALNPRVRDALVQSDIAAGVFTICDMMRLLKLTLGLKVIVVADATLGCINQVATTLTSLYAEGFAPQDLMVILNRFKQGDAMYENNKAMITAMTGVKVIATIAEQEQELTWEPGALAELLQIIK